MKTFLIIYFVVLFVLFFPINLKTKISFNFYDNSGFLSLYFYRLKLGLFLLSFSPFKIVLHSPKKQIKLDLFSLKNSSKYGEVFLSNIIDVTHINNANMFLSFGIFDAFISSTFCALVDSLGMSAITLSLPHKHFDNFSFKAMPCYFEDTFVIALSLSATINIFWIIFCLIKSLFETIANARKFKTKSNK